MAKENPVKSATYNIVVDKARNDLIAEIFSHALGHPGFLRSVKERGLMEELKSLGDELSKKIHEQEGWCTEADCPYNKKDA